MTKAEFEKEAGASLATLSKWEKTEGFVTMKAQSLEGLQRLFAKANSESID